MSFIKRLKNIISAKANKTLDKHENPVELLTLSINKKEELLKNAKKQCANFVASVDSMRKENESLLSKSRKYEEATKAALYKKDEAQAQSFIKQKLEIETKYDEGNERIQEQTRRIEEIKNKITNLEIEISNMKSKKQELATRLDVAEINSEINETLAGLNDDNGISLNELEKKVIQKENYSSALEELKPANEESLLDEYISNSPSADASVNNELERIKKEMGL